MAKIDNIADFLKKGRKKFAANTDDATRRAARHFDNTTNGKVIEFTGTPSSGTAGRKVETKAAENASRISKELDAEIKAERVVDNSHIPANRAPNQEILNKRKKLEQKYANAVDANVKDIVETDRKTLGGFRQGDNYEKLEANIERANQYNKYTSGGVDSNNSTYETRGKREFSAEERASRRKAAEDAKKAKMLEAEQELNRTQGSIKDHNESKVKEEASKQKDKKKEESRKFFTNDNIKKTVGLGVGGALVFNMFDKGGQMSNAELYGQQSPYGY